MSQLNISEQYDDSKRDGIRSESYYNLLDSLKLLNASYCILGMSLLLIFEADQGEIR